MDVGRTRNWPASKEFARAEVYLALPPHNAPGGRPGGESAAAAAPGGEDDCDADSLVGGRYGTLKDAMMPSWPWYYQVWLRKWAAESVRAIAGIWSLLQEGVVVCLCQRWQCPSMVDASWALAKATY